MDAPTTQVIEFCRRVARPQSLTLSSSQEMGAKRYFRNASVGNGLIPCGGAYFALSFKSS